MVSSTDLSFDRSIQSPPMAEERIDSHTEIDEVNDEVSFARVSETSN
jgi:hypothetical protein